MHAPFDLRRRELLLTALALAAGGCGGVDSGGTGTGMSPTYASGPIDGFGSVIVGGVHFDDSSAHIEDDAGHLLARDALKLGMRTEILASAVSVNAGISSAVAESIRVRSEILGPIESIDIPGGLLRVLGQRVRIVASTVFDSALSGGLAALAVGDTVEVHGTLDLAGARYVASRIERRTGVAGYTLRGVVATLSLAAQTITLGDALIDWSRAAPSDPATALAPGRLVRLSLELAPVAGVWRASAVTSGAMMLADREFAEVEGRITAFTSATAFVLNGIPVDATAASPPAGLALGVRVEVHGSLRSGVLVASRIQIENDDASDAGAFEVEGTIDTVEAPPAQRFTVRGVSVNWSAATRFVSSTAADIKVGRKVAVTGPLSADRTRIDATSIHVEL
jgi:Domain of unknown function (DUF5666)